MVDVAIESECVKLMSVGVHKQQGKKMIKHGVFFTFAIPVTVAISSLILKSIVCSTFLAKSEINCLFTTVCKASLRKYIFRVDLYILFYFMNFSFAFVFVHIAFCLSIYRPRPAYGHFVITARICVSCFEHDL